MNIFAVRLYYYYFDCKGTGKFLTKVCKKLNMTLIFFILQTLYGNLQKNNTNSWYHL